MARGRKPKGGNASSEDPWAFLTPWFDELVGRLNVADETRLDSSPRDLGREPKTDWWICVHYDDQDDSRKTIKQITEAVILISILADVDYDAWLRHLLETCGLEAPYISVQSKQLRPHYQVDFEPGDETRRGEEIADNQAFLVDWKKYAQPMFGFDKISAKFKRDYVKAMALAQEAIVQPCVPRLQLRMFAPLNISIRRYVDYLYYLHETLANLQALS